jgi:hypothetical protein
VIKAKVLCPGITLGGKVYKPCCYAEASDQKQETNHACKQQCYQQTFDAEANRNLCAGSLCNTVEFARRLVCYEWSDSSVGQPTTEECRPAAGKTACCTAKAGKTV